MSLHGRARGRPESQARRHARTDREARERRLEQADCQRSLGRPAGGAAVCDDNSRSDFVAQVGSTPVAPGAIHTDGEGGLTLAAATGGEVIGESGARSAAEPSAANSLPVPNAAQSIAMGSNVQFSQTHSKPAGDDD